MADQKDPTPEPVGRKTSVNLDNYSSTTRQMVTVIVALANTVLGEGAAKELDGSASVTIKQKVVAKVLPQEPGPHEYVLLGVSSVFAPQGWENMPAKYEGTFRIKQSGFHFFLLEQPNAVADAETVLLELKKRLG